MKKLVLIDGNALLHRAYHATPPLSTSKGELINAVLGFTNMLLKAWDDLTPDYLIMTWDKKAPTFRHAEYTQYKATRGPADEALSSQYERVHEVVDALNIPEFGLEGYEADDLIGTLATQAYQKDKDLEVIILTGDRDIMQVINDRVKVLMPRKTLTDVGLYGIEEFKDRFGFEPIQIIDYKALAGDASDNIPGVAGIGGVTATKLINQFGSMENIYKDENLKTLPERTQKLLAEGAESAVMSKKLATIDLKAPIKLDFKACLTSDYDKQKAIKLFEELEFKVLVNKLTGSGKDPVSGVIASGAKQSSLEKEFNKIATSTSAPRNDRGVQSQETIDLDLKVQKVLDKMKENGIKIDLKFLDQMGKDLKKRLSELESEIYKTIGHEFNINSPKQLADILFDELDLPVVRKTKTGRSTDEATLQELKEAHPCIPLILEYRTLYKLCSTYIDTLPTFADENSRVHSTFNVEGAATGRLSSTNPNLQNIPIKGEIGGELRKAFIVEKGNVLLGADYSQIELRILAHLCKDENLIKAFSSGEDIHAITASKIFNVSISDITKHQRMVGKTMNFATLYGQGPRALAQQLGIEYGVAKQYILEYFEQFPKVKEWMQTILEFGYKNGFVETISGRRRYIPELLAGNKFLKSFGERAAINHPIQGTSADMIKIAMVEIDKSLNEIATSPAAPRNDVFASEAKQSSQLVLQIHDELLFECDPKNLDKVAKLIKEKMESALPLSVPVVADLKSGPNWGEMTSLSLD